MRSGLDDSGALECMVEQWAARIGHSSGRTVEDILLQAENVMKALCDLRPYGPKARIMLQAHARLSQPALSRLEAIGRHAELMRLRASKLPPSVSSLYALTRMPWNRFLKAIEIDLRGMSRAGIQQLFAHAPPSRKMCRLLTIKIAPEVNETARAQLIADIGAAVARIAENRKIDLKIIPAPQAAGHAQKLKLAPGPVSPKGGEPAII